MTEAEEATYELGQRSVLTRQLDALLRELGYDDLTRYVSEREAVITTLREICAKHGDNNWDASLHLADVIDNHLGRHLESSKR